MAWKPGNDEEAAAALSSGLARRIAPPEGFMVRHIPSGDTSQRVRRSDGKYIWVTGYAKLILNEAPAFAYDEGAAEKILRKARKGALAALALVRSPIADVIARGTGSERELGYLRQVFDVLSQDSKEKRVHAAIDAFGSDKLEVWADLLEKRLADGDLSEQDKADLLGYWA